MIKILGQLCAASALFVLLVACGSDDDTAGSDGTSTVASTMTAAPAVSPASDASPTTTSVPLTATPTSEPTTAASPDSEATPQDEAGAELEYEEVAAWDASWEGLGAMVSGPDGRLYIDDYVRDQLMVFTTDGNEQPPLPYTSEHPEMVQARSDLAIGRDGRLYLLEQGGGTWIKVFETDGTLVNEWGGTVGFEPESLFDARTIAVGQDGQIFTNRSGVLQKFTSDGEFVAAWDRAGDYLFPAEVYDMEVADGVLYVAAGGYRDDQAVIMMFDFDGNLVAEPIVVGEGDIEGRIFPASLAIGPDGNLFIADPFNREIIILSPSGDELGRWSLDATEQRFPSIEIAVDVAGRVFVADDGHKRVSVYATDTGNSTDGP